MSTTLTIRTDDALREELRKRAQAQGKSVSQVVREALQQSLVERPLSARSGQLRGQLDLSEIPEDSWRRQLRERNWRP
jgi:predicted transcriptional regulator